MLTLRTLGSVSLSGAHGEIPLEEPGVVAFLVLLVIAGDDGVSEGDLLLRLTPAARAEHGRLELARLVAVTNLSLGSKAAVARTRTGYALAPGVVEADVRVLSEVSSSECAEFLAGFKLAGSPEFSAWLAETRRLVVPVGRVRRPLSARLSRRALALSGLVAAVLAVAAYVAKPRPIKDFSTGDPLLVADVRNETGDTVFDVSLMSATTIALQQSGRLRLYARSRLPEVYARMRIANLDTALTLELATDVAQRDGVRFVLGLEVSRTGERYRVTARLVDVSRADRVKTASALARDRSEVLTALDEVLLAVRARLGEPRADIEGRSTPLPYVTTASLEALRSYGDGTAAWSRGNYRLASEMWLRAIDIDTGFAMAYAALGGAYYFGHDRDKGEQYFTEAFKRASRLSERERLRLKESWFGYRGNRDSSRLYSLELARRYPSVVTWYNYGTGLIRAGRDSEARAALHTALSYDPRHVSSYINLATIAAGTAPESAIVYYTRAGQLDSMALYRNNINHEYGATLVHLGRYAEAESAFVRMSRSRSVDDRAFGLRSLGYLAAWRGRTGEAIEYYRRAVEASVQRGSPLGEARNRMLLSTAYRTASRDREANDEITRTMRLIDSPVIPPQVLAMLATNAFKLGRVPDMRVIIRAIQKKTQAGSKVDAAAAAYVEGLLALSAGRADSALGLALAAAALPTRVQRLALEVEAYRALGRADSARAAVERLVAIHGFGLEGQDDWLRAPLVLGDMLLSQHDTVGAVREYERLLDRWRDVPPGQADAAAARSRLAVLRSGALDRRRR